MRNTPIILLAFAVMALIIQHRQRILSIFTPASSPHHASSLGVRKIAAPPLDVKQQPPSPPPPPPSTLAVAVANRVAASLAAEAAEDLKTEFNSTCNPTPHAGFSGGAFTWGLTFKVMSAADCCSACQAHRRVCRPGTEGQIFHVRFWQGSTVPARCLPMQGSRTMDTTCNAWVFCPENRCWSSDKWNHTYGECWLKWQKNPLRPHAGARGAYPEKFRARHVTAPPLVSWISGALTEGQPIVDVDGPHWPAWAT